MGDERPDRGVMFPLHEGRRSTTALGQLVAAAALAQVDPVGARSALGETTWRSGYVEHFRRLVEAGLGDAQDWVTIARQGLQAVHDGMVLAGPDGERPLADGLPDTAGEVETATITGTALPAPLGISIGGSAVTGDRLRTTVSDWIARDVMEPSVLPAVEAALAHPEGRRLDGHTVVVCGAGAEMGPVEALLAWGATVAAVDLPDPAVWRRLLAAARDGAGTLLVPVHPDRGTPSDATGDEELAAMAGLDLLGEPGAVACWVAQLPDTIVLANTAYADGGLHVRLSAAIDAIGQRVVAERPDMVHAFLATPTDVFVVPRDAVRASVAAYESRSTTARLLGRPLRTVTRGRLLARNHAPGSEVGIVDALVPAQGPNYALAKRIQRWRATVAAADGQRVSLHVAPSSRTTSVTRNRVLAAAYAGADRFGVEVFDPATANTLMAVLLVADLNRDAPSFDHPWQAEAHEAVHGGLWRAAYAPRSALGLAAVLGYASSRR